MTIALSFIFSLATELAMASSSALLAEMALAMIVKPLLFGFELVRPIGGERHTSSNQRVGQYQLGVAHQREGDGDVAGLGIGEQNVLALHAFQHAPEALAAGDRSEEHTSELQSLMRISYAVF